MFYRTDFRGFRSSHTPYQSNLVGGINLVGEVVKVPMIQVSIHLRLLHISYDYTHQVMSWGSCCVCALKYTLFPVDHDNTD